MHGLTARVISITMKLGRGRGYFILAAHRSTHRYTHAPMLTHGQSKLDPTLHKMGSKYKLCIVKIMLTKGLLHNQGYWKCHYINQDETKIKINTVIIRMNLLFTPSTHHSVSPCLLSENHQNVSYSLFEITDCWLPGNVKDSTSIVFFHSFIHSFISPP
jgi:hypothetical protein